MPFNRKKIESIIGKAYTRKPIVDHPQAPMGPQGTHPDYSPQREESPQERERRERKWDEFMNGYTPKKEDL